MSQPGQNPPRRIRGYVSILGTTQMHLRNPLVVAFWSALFPGVGHLLLSKYIRGFILFIWEIAVNLFSHLNLAIFYTLIGRFDQVRQVLVTPWLLLYIPTYLFAIWDSYRTAADLNNQFVLAVREDAQVRPFILNSLGVNYLDKGSPWVAAVWSMLAPGVGQLILHRILVAFFLIAWWIADIYYSNVLHAIHYTALGMFDQAKAVLDPQWLLNIPSLYLFSIYDAYVNTVESNKLFEWEQAKFLKRQYQGISFPMPFKKLKQGDKMYIVSNFEHTVKLETAITAIEMKGIPREDILAVPMDKKNEDRMLFDRTHSSDNLSMLDVPMILGVLFALLGLSYGFVWSWGPILWAVIGTALGIGLGILIKLYTTRRRKVKRRAQTPEVVLMIACDDTQAQMVQDTLWAYSALGVAKLSLGSDSLPSGTK